MPGTDYSMYITTYGRTLRMCFWEVAWQAPLGILEYSWGILGAEQIRVNFGRSWGPPRFAQLVSKPVISGEFGAETHYWAWVRFHGVYWGRTQSGPFFYFSSLVGVDRLCAPDPERVS
jgi:hypothetical protein